MRTKSPETLPLSARDERILQIATTVFASRGYRNTDVQEIADLAQVGKGTVYRAFGNKDELFFATVDYGMRQLSEQMAQVHSQVPCTPASSTLENWLFTFFAFFEEHPELVELLMQERSEFRDRDSHSYIRHWLSNTPAWRARISESIDAGRLRAIEPEQLIDALSALCYGTIFISYFSRRRINLETTAKLLSEIVHFGVLTDSERERTMPKESTQW